MLGSARLTCAATHVMRGFVLLLAGLLSGAAFGAPRDPATKDRRPLRAGASALEEACADCHAAIVASYTETPMARALSVLAPGDLAPDLAVLESASGFRYHLETAGQRTWVVESLPGEESGARRHRDSARVVFAIGAGVLDRSLAVTKHGRLWFAPLEILSGTGADAPRAALAPGHAIEAGQRFGVPITPECLACHTDSLPPRTWPLHLELDARTWTPRGIGCGACHARAGEHVVWRAEELSGRAPRGPDPLAATTSAPRHVKMSTCAACHLQGDARIELENGRLGPPEPGGDLLETRAVFAAREPSDAIGFVSQTERLVLSRCYLESSSFGAQALTCSTCHDPHVTLADAREIRRARQDACLACHAGTIAHESLAHACSLDANKKVPDQDCASCHLRQTSVFDVAEVAIHDHWIRKDPGPPSPRVPLRLRESPSSDWARFRWPDAPAPEHVDDPGLTMMALAHASERERAKVLLDAPPTALTLQLAMYHHVRGSLLEEAGRPKDALASYERALALDPDLAESKSNLALVLGRLGKHAEGIALLDQLIARHPKADGALRNRATLHYQTKDLAGFERDLEAAFALLPSAELARAYANYWRQEQKLDLATRWDEEARRLDPRR